MNLCSYPEDVLRGLRGFIKFLDWKLNLEKLSKNSIDLFTVFLTFDMDKLGKIRQHHWKERFKVSKIA